MRSKWSEEILSKSLEILGETRLRARGSLDVSTPRELLVRPSIPAAFDLDGRLAWDTRRLWGAEDRLPDCVPGMLPKQDVVQVCDEEVVWGGCASGHYGHFLTESVARLWPLLPGGELEGLSVVCSRPPNSPYAREWAEAFGLQAVDLPKSGVTRFTRMFVPEPAWRLNAWIGPEIRDIHLHARRSLDVPTAPRQGVLWLSRSALHREQLAYDEVLLEWLLGEHVTIVNPETKTLAEQIAAIEASDGVAGLVGSAFHTLLMAAEPPDCVLLCAGMVQSAYLAQDLLLNTNGAFVHALAIAEIRRRRRSKSLGGYRVLVPEALRALSATVLPNLKEDSRIVALAYPERLSPGGGKGRQGDVEMAVARVLLDPYSAEARMKLGALFEGWGLSNCALEQFLTVAELSDNAFAPALLGATRMLARLNRRDEASAMAKQALAVDPGSREAAGYVLDT